MLLLTNKASAGFYLAMVQCVCRGCSRCRLRSQISERRVTLVQTNSKRAQNLLLSTVCDRDRHAFAAILQHRSGTGFGRSSPGSLRPSHGCDVAVRAACSSSVVRDQLIHPGDATNREPVLCLALRVCERNFLLARSLILWLVRCLMRVVAVMLLLSVGIAAEAVSYSFVSKASGRLRAIRFEFYLDSTTRPKTDIKSFTVSMRTADDRWKAMWSILGRWSEPIVELRLLVLPR